MRHVWQSKSWPKLTWDGEALLEPLGKARRRQGTLLAEAQRLGLDVQAEVMAEEALMTSAIEGEKLDPSAVRSSVARRLGLPSGGLPPGTRRTDGLVEMLVDATAGYATPLSGKRLKEWQAALFPTGYSATRKIRVGEWRREEDDPMRVVSGPPDREKVHFEAPPGDRVPQEMKRFLEWWDGSSPETTDGLLRAGMAHFWFVTIHPFDDGNGRVARAITDMALAGDESSPRRLYSMSAQIYAERQDYCAILEKTQKGTGDITGWLAWFLGCLERSIQRSESHVETALRKGRFWQDHAETNLNERQHKVVNRLLDCGPGGFEGGLTNRKYVGMTKTSRETAKRDITDLVTKGILRRNPGGGRSANYDLAWPAS